MAVGFPAKTTYANGDVFSASDINDTNGTLNLVNPATNPAGQSNPVLNSAFQVWQRGTSISVSATTGYTADRWNLAAAAGQTDTVSRQLTADTTNLPFIQYCARVQRNSGQTATGFIAFAQSLETINSIPYAGKTVTLSFYARRGANYSSASNALTVALFSGTGTDQNINTGYTGSNAFINTTRTLTTTWQRFEVTGTMPTTGTELSPYFGYTPVGTAGAADFFEITGVQLEVGSVATPFKTYAGTIQGELAACQRYLPSWTNAPATVTALAIGQAYSTTQAAIVLPNPVTARVPASGITLIGTTYQLYNSVAAAQTGTNIVINTSTNSSTQIVVTVGASLVAGNATNFLIGQGVTILGTGCEL